MVGMKHVSAHMSGFCVGELLVRVRAINDRIGLTVANFSDIWPEHPEKFSAPQRMG